MKPKFGTKLLSLLLCVCMLIPMFTACKNKDKDDDNKPLSWEATAEQVIPLEMEVQNGESNTKLVLSYGEDIFSSIENDQIKLTVYQKAASSDETAESTESSITERTPTDFTASVTNAKQLTITVPSTENDWGYLVAVHSSAISSGKFGESWGFNHEVIEEYISYSATISGEYATGDVNPVITVTLENTVAAAGLTKEMITLTGLFEGLEITSVSGSESTITIVTSGTVAVATPFFAGVELAEGATNSGVELTADCEVAYRSAYVKQDSFALASGILTFDAVITSDTVTLAVNDALTADGITYMVKAVSEDKTTVTLGVATTASDLDSAIAEINGKTLEIPANKTASANAHTLTIYAIRASVGGSVDYIEETATANTYSATAILFVKNGVWNGTLTTSDITLGGDFDGATVTSVTKDGDSYEVVFTFAKEGLDLDDISLEGTANIAEGKVKNAWGTTLAENDATLTYITGLDRGETWDAIKGFIDANKSTFDTISTVGGAVSGVASAAGGVVSILELVGVLESTNDKLDSIRDMVALVNLSLQNLDSKVSNISSLISKNDAELQLGIDKSARTAASDGWNAFLTNTVTPLSNIVTKYEMKYNEYVLSWIGSASSNEGIITVYIDVNGNVTLPHPSNNQYAIDGTKIAASVNCRLTTALEAVTGKVMANGGRLYDGYWTDIKSTTNLSVVDENGTGVSSVTVDQYLQAVQITAAKYALDKVGAENILNAYTNFCYTLAGKTNGSKQLEADLRPLGRYYTMLSMYYNFYAEAEQDIQITRAWIGSLLIEYSGLATLAHTFTPSAASNMVTNAYNAAVDELNTNTGEEEALYCYVVGKKLTVLSGTIGVKGWDDVNGDYLARGFEMSDGSWWKHGLPTSRTFMSAKNIQVMKMRYEILKSAGVTSASTFAAYLVSLNVLDASALTANGGDLSKSYVITDNLRVESYSANCEVALPIIRDDGEWYKLGDVCKIGDWKKLDREYFSVLYRTKVDAVDLTGKEHSSLTISTIADYWEWFWFSENESYFFEERLSGPFYAFVLE